MNLDMSLIVPLAGLVGAIGLDWAAGVAVAVKAGTFRWSELPAVLESTVGPYVSGPAILAILGGFANGEHSGATDTITAAVIAMCASYAPRFLSDARAKLLAWSAGITVPKKVA